MANFNKDDYVERTSLQIDEGDYPFSVVGAEDKTSRNGNDMIALEMQFDVGAEKPMTVFSHLVFTPKALYQIKGFCEATGLTEKWDTEALEADDCLGVEGIAHLFLGEPQQNGKRYMEVQYFCKPESFSKEPIKNNLTPDEQQKLDKARSLIKKPEPVTNNHEPDGSEDDLPF